MAVSREWNIVVNQYTQSGFIDRVENCNAFMFTNLGDTVCEVNGMPIFPSSTPASVLGDSRTIGGLEGEVYTGNIKISFAPGGAAPLVEVVQKFYTKL